MRATSPIVLVFSLLLAAALCPQPSRSAAGVSRTICPVITVECPSEPVKPGTFVNFKAKVSGAAPDLALTYKWTASAGTVTSGTEGKSTTGKGNTESTAVVDSTGLPSNATVTATVEVGGIDRSCSTVAACTTSVFEPPAPHALDHYGNITFADEMALLDNFAIELQNSPDFNGYIECYGGRVGPQREAVNRCERAKRYLSNRRGIASDRIVLIDGGYRERLEVGLWILPPGTNFTPLPTVDPKDVRFIKERTKSPKRPPRQRHITP